MKRIRVSKLITLNLAAAMVSAGLFLSLAGSDASAQPAPQPTAPATQPAAPPPADPAAPGTPATAAPTDPAAPPATPVLGPDGLPIPPVTPPEVVIPDKIPLIDANGTPVTVNGQPVMVRVKRGPDGKPMVDPVTQQPVPMPVLRDEQGNVQIDPATNEAILDDGKPRHDLTPMGMFMQATVVVKVVMVMLLMASIATWTILFSKLSYFRSLNTRTDRFLEQFRGFRGSLQDLSKSVKDRDRRIPMVQMLEAATNEIDATFTGGSSLSGEKREHLTSRISAAMSIAQSSNSAALGSGMGVLATTGSISPFVGLFGTVWGIMNSFIGIANSNTTNLAVVAPGIAEALFATAIGLFAAIPAVIFYNIFTRKISAYNTRLENFSGELLVRVSRQLDQMA